MAFSRVSIAVAAFVALASANRSAHACGGTFCDSGPTSMPVDQRGENILFVMNGHQVEAHIQIRYQGAASRFGWVLPMPTVPSFAVGTQALFDNLLASTVPTYGYGIQADFCGSASPSCACGSSADGAAFGGTGSGTSGAAGGGTGPTVVEHATVGAFDVTVLQGGTAQEVSDWLDANGYRSTSDTPELLQTYVAKSYVFVAVKLAPGAGVDEIHPLVVRYPGSMPCVPLVLTRVGALANMGVRVFFLGRHRWFPENWAHVVLNPARLDWVDYAPDYDEVVAQAVDAHPADGHGFVTEFAGESRVVRRRGIIDPRWNAAAFEQIAPEKVVTTLEEQGLAHCNGTCVWNHPLVLALLEKYLPVPNGLTADPFYANLETYAFDIDLNVWSASGFAADFQAFIVDPGQNAIDALDNLPYLTRMFTRISPSEMTEDPTFLEEAALDSPAVFHVHDATERIACDGKMGMILPNGYDIALGSDGGWPTWPSSMPWALQVEHASASGITTDANNDEAIGAAIADWNASQGWPEHAGGCSTAAGRDRTGSFAFGSLALVALARRRWRRRS